MAAIDKMYVSGKELREAISWAGSMDRLFLKTVTRRICLLISPDITRTLSTALKKSAILVSMCFGILLVI